MDISDQTMHVFVNGETKYFWLVSTARRGYRTPIGNFKPFRMHREYYSKKYHGSPMPYSVFFHGGYAIHGTDAIKALGRPASHGCIRLDPRDAEKLYWLIKTVGHQNTHIEITR
ncbi:L,D-transpeptidase [Polycladidibacter stylochi]|uniref:L,D-transpeptidase n=1 Tax=Polycladidibacter stylochi TaxID=1807766 RepID=UPI001FCB5C43|nr:L,D-transpeptidase [Pseudovibrio stylochi]